MTPVISLIHVDADESARNETLTTLKSFGGNIHIAAATIDLRVAMKIIPDANPQVVMLHVKDIDQGVKDVSLLTSAFPEISVFATADDKDPDWILRLVRAGAGEYLTRPIARPELAEALQKVAKVHSHKSGLNKSKGSVVCLYNPSGGMGTTTLAVNVAASLMQQEKKVALVDLNLLNGDIGAFLDLSPRYNITDIIPKIGHLDASFLKSVLTPHPSGLNVLCGPLHISDTYKLSSGLMHEIMSVFQATYDYTVVDTGGQISEYNMAAFHCSDLILFTTVLNLPALKNSKRYLGALRDEGFETEKLAVVINRHLPKGEIKLADAEKVLGAKAYGTIPNAYNDAVTAINKGEPLINCCPRSPITRAIDQLAHKLAQDLGKGQAIALKGV